MKCVLDEDVPHHAHQTYDHDVQQIQLFRHPQCQAFIGEQLHADVDHSVAQRIRIGRSLQHHRDPTVMLHESPCQGLFVIRVGQHVEQQADDFLWKLELHCPEHQLLQEGFVHEILLKGLVVLVLVIGFRDGQGFQCLFVYSPRLHQILAVFRVWIFGYFVQHSVFLKIITEQLRSLCFPGKQTLKYVLVKIKSPGLKVIVTLLSTSVIEFLAAIFLVSLKNINKEVIYIIAHALFCKGQSVG